MVSGTEDLQTVYSCLKEGADDYILKPVRQAVMKNLWSNVWKKRREHQIIHQLENERNKCSSLDKELSDLKNKVEDLNSKIDQAVDTPISVITRTILDLQRQANLTPEVKTALSTIVQSLGSSNLYKPALCKIADSDSLDPVTKKWLLVELGSQINDKAMDLSGDGVHWSTNRDLNEQLIKDLQSFTLDVWQQKEEDLVDYLIVIFKDFNLLEIFNINEEKMRKFLIAVRSRYIKANPYHNFIHGFDVAQSIYSYLTNGKGATYLSHIEILSLLVAAICHDVAHPGVSNLFLIATSHPLSLRYNDNSILENFHASTTFEILADPETNIFENLSVKDFRTVRKLIISSILATDLSKHMEITNKLEAISGNFCKDEADHRLLLMQILIKTADISNPAKPFSIARYWADLVQEEFFMQVCSFLFSFLLFIFYF